MKRTVFALLVSLSAFAQAPVVESITPNNGPDRGGTTVSIRGTNLNMIVACLLPCPPRVGFGDVFVDAIEVSDRQLDVVTPAHAAGTVDVTIDIPGRPTTVVEDGFTFLETLESRYELVLLPIYFKGVIPGVAGSEWATDLWIHNGGVGPALIADRVCPEATPCPPVIPVAIPLLPGESFHNPEDFFRRERHNPSQLLYISKQAERNVSVGLRVADTSRHALNGGTEVPVIREGKFLSQRAQLLNVPLDNRTYRLLLRVYEVNYGDAQFAVRFFPAAEGIGQAVYGTTLTTTTPVEGSFPSEAAYAELDITQLLNLRLAWPEVARIEIEPLTPGSRYWAFVSLTNNETQLVTLVTPQ
jgi:IPT/TIG domain